MAIVRGEHLTAAMRQQIEQSHGQHADSWYHDRAFVFTRSGRYQQQIYRVDSKRKAADHEN